MSEARDIAQQDRGPVIDDLLASAAALRAENAALRSIVSRCASAIGNGAVVSTECSVEFMAHVPEEIRLRIAALTRKPVPAP